MKKQRFLKEVDIVVKGWGVESKEKFLSTTAPFIYQLNEKISKIVESDCKKLAFLLWDLGKKPEQIVNLTAFDKINGVFIVEQEFDFNKFASLESLETKYSCIIDLITKSLSHIEKQTNIDLKAFELLLSDPVLQRPIIHRKVGRGCKSESKKSAAQLFFNFNIDQIELGVEISTGTEKQSIKQIFATYPTSMVSVLYEIGKLSTMKGKLIYVPKSHYEAIEVCQFT